MRVDEVTFELGVPRPYAYKLIKKVNEELESDRVYYDPRSD